MDRFIAYLRRINKFDDDKKRIVNVFKRMNNVITDNKKDYDNFDFLIKNKDEIRTWLLNNLSTSSVSFYSIALRHAISSMNIPESKKAEMVRFYLDIAAESQRVSNRIAGRVVREFEPKRAIQDFDEMIKNKPTFIVENDTPKIEKVVRAIPQWSDSGEPIETQIKAFVETLNGPSGKPLRITSKKGYVSNIKTVMNRMHKTNLDFLLTDVPSVLAFLDTVDNSKTGAEAYLSRQSSRTYETAIVTMLPLAKTNDPNDRVIAKDQYNQWLTAHKLLPTPSQIKDYGGTTWPDAVREMNKKIKSSKNELHKLILSLYTDTPPRRSLDYANMLINEPDNKEDNILVFTPKVKMFIFNQYKTSNKKGPQHIPIISPSLIKILDEHLKNNPNQKYLLMRKDKPLNDTQIREIVRTEIGSKDKPFGIQMIRRLFATYIVKENKTNPRDFKQYAAKMGTSVEMLMSNYTQIPAKEDEDKEYVGLDDMSEEEDEEKIKKNKKREYQRSDEYKATRNTRNSNKKAKK